MIESDKKLVNIKSLNKKQKDIFNKYGINGELSCYIKCPFTGMPYKVHPDIVKRLSNGERLTLEEILNKKFD